MDKTKIIYGIASFLFGATGSTMFLIGKSRGEKKVKKEILDKVKIEVSVQQVRESVAKDMQEYEKRCINIENQRTSPLELEVTYKSLCESKYDDWREREIEAKLSKEFLQSIVDNS